MTFFFFLIFLQSSDLVFLGFLDPGNLLPPDPYSIKVAAVWGGGGGLVVEEQEDRPIYMCLFTSLAPVRSYGCDFFNFLAILLLPGGFPLLAQAVVSQRAVCGRMRECVHACVRVQNTSREDCCGGSGLLAASSSPKNKQQLFRSRFPKVPLPSGGCGRGFLVEELV